MGVTTIYICATGKWPPYNGGMHRSMDDKQGSELGGHPDDHIYMPAGRGSHRVITEADTVTKTGAPLRGDK